MKTKEIVLLIFIIAAGVFFYHVQTGKIDISIDYGDILFWNFEEFTFEESHMVEAPIPSRLYIVNSHGKIEIQGTNEERISIDFQKKIWRKNEDQARKVAEKLKLTLTKEKSRIRISTNRSEFQKKNFNTNFRISVPRRMEVKVENSYGFVRAYDVGRTEIYNRHGEVLLSKIKGDANVINSYEDVEIENVSSDCSVESKYADILARNINGQLKIEHKYGKIEVENVIGKVEIKSPHTKISGSDLNGGVEIQNSYEKITLKDVGSTKILGHHSNVEAEGVRGELRISNSYAWLSLENIEGNLGIEGKSLSVSGNRIVGEDIFVSTSYRNIELTEFSARTTVNISNGDTLLKPLLISQPIQVKSEYGTITFFWPEGEELPFEVRVKSGEIKWNLPFEVSLREEGRTTTARAFLKETDKPLVFLTTTYGDIVVKEQDRTISR